MSAAIRDGVIQGVVAELTDVALSTPQGQAAVGFAASTAMQTGATAAAAVSALVTAALPVAVVGLVIASFFAALEES